MSDADNFLSVHRFCKWDSKDRFSGSFALCVRTCDKGKTPEYKGNKNALYASEEGFIIFNDLLHRLFPHFYWYDDTCISPSECVKLETALYGLVEKLEQAGDVHDIEALFNVRETHFSGVPMTIIKPRLNLMIQDFISLTSEAVKANHDLWLMGL